MKVEPNFRKKNKNALEQTKIHRRQGGEKRVGNLQNRGGPRVKDHGKVLSGEEATKTKSPRL